MGQITGSLIRRACSCRLSASELAWPLLSGGLLEQHQAFFCADLDVEFRSEEPLESGPVADRAPLLTSRRDDPVLAVAQRAYFAIEDPGRYEVVHKNRRRMSVGVEVPEFAISLPVTGKLETVEREERTVFKRLQVELTGLGLGHAKHAPPRATDTWDSPTGKSGPNGPKPTSTRYRSPSRWTSVIRCVRLG